MNNNFIPYSRQTISENDIQAVVDVLRSDWLTQGPAVERFEKAVSDYCGARYAVAVNSATSALHLACLAVGLGPDDTLWTSPNTFVASANCGRFCGAQVDFVDINPRTYNLSVRGLEQKLISAEKRKKLPKVVIPVHFAGQSCEMIRISELARQYNFSVIEDASHAIGGQYRGKKIGNCAFSDMTVFSFHPVKIITTGEGGMVLTNNEKYYQQLIRLRTHGITRDVNLMDTPDNGGWYYQQVDLGFNYRITDIQAALGINQLERIDEFVKHRRKLAQRYTEAFIELPLILPQERPGAYSAFHLYVVRLQLSKLKRSRREIFDLLREKGIGVNVHYIPVHMQPYYRGLGFSPGDFPEAENYYNESLTLPLYPSLSLQEQDYVIDSVREVLA